jgi:arginine utilization protein RocB
MGLVECSTPLLGAIPAAPAGLLSVAQTSRRGLALPNLNSGLAGTRLHWTLYHIHRFYAVNMQPQLTYLIDRRLESLAFSSA